MKTLPLSFFAKVFKAETLGLDFARNSIARRQKVKEIGNADVQSLPNRCFRSDLLRDFSCHSLQKQKARLDAGLGFAPDLRLAGVSRGGLWKSGSRFPPPASKLAGDPGFCANDPLMPR